MRQMNYATFWMVWNPYGAAPRHKHQTEASAFAEAERLARLNKGQVFVVLESIGARLVDDMVKINMRADCDIPF